MFLFDEAMPSYLTVFIIMRVQTAQPRICIQLQIFHCLLRAQWQRID